MMATTKQSTPGFMERHYTIAELSEAWGLAEATIRVWFIDVPGVIKVGGGKPGKGRKRTRVTLRIPASIVDRIYAERTAAPGGRQ